MVTSKHYKISATVFIAFFIFLMAGWSILIGAFEFPDILRKSAVERFTLFQKNEGIIVPAYYMMSLTSISQVFMAVTIYHVTKKGKMLDMIALTSGILSGVFQILGFFRWVILIPMLSDAYHSKEVSPEIVFFLEKFANTYFGMTVGEHLGSLFTGVWLIALGVILMKNSGFDKKLSALGVVSGIAIFTQSFETVSSSLSFLGHLTAALWGLYLTWVLIMSIMLFKKKAETAPMKVHLGIWVLGFVFYLANVIPSFM